jgi:DNA-binding transcriptional ArsR family regulator
MLDDLRQPRPHHVLIDIAPVLNALASLATVADAGQSPGISQWAVQTSERLSETEWVSHRILSDWIGSEALGNLLRDEEALTSFPAYLEALARIDPEDLRNRLVYWMAARPSSRLNYKPVPGVDDPLSLLQSPEDLLAFLEQPDVDPEKRQMGVLTHGYLVDPPRLQGFVTAYLAHFWDEHLKEEWRQNLSELEEAVSGFRESDVTGMTHFEVIETITGRDLRGVYRPEVLQSYSTLRFIPSPHCGPYVMKTSDGQELRIAFGAQQIRRPFRAFDETAGDYLVPRMKALADETRLEIILLLRGAGELGTQDIIDRLNLSKSAASRHLRQLYATGMVDVRVDEDGLSKYYRLNRAKASQLQEMLGRLLG